MSIGQNFTVVILSSYYVLEIQMWVLNLRWKKRRLSNIKQT